MNISSHEEECKWYIITETFYQSKLSAIIDITGNDSEQLECGNILRKFLQPSDSLVKCISTKSKMASIYRYRLKGSLFG